MSLLSLPAEIHDLIFRSVLEDRIVCIYDEVDTSRGQDRSSLRIAPLRSRSTIVAGIESYDRHAAALCMTCRQFHTELQPKLYRYAFLAFISTKAFESFVRARGLRRDISLFDIEELANIHLDIGPAKYAEERLRSRVHDTFQTLTRDAVHLSVLSLSVRYYFGADEDIIPLDDAVLLLLLRFTNLKEVSIVMYGRPPGPVGGPVDPKAATNIDRRLKCLCEILLQKGARRNTGRSSHIEGDLDVLANVKGQIADKVQREDTITYRTAST